MKWLLLVSLVSCCGLNSYAVASSQKCDPVRIQEVTKSSERRDSSYSRPKVNGHLPADNELLITRYFERGTFNNATLWLKVRIGNVAKMFLLTEWAADGDNDPTITVSANQIVILGDLVENVISDPVGNGESTSMAPEKIGSFKQTVILRSFKGSKIVVEMQTCTN